MKDFLSEFEPKKRIKKEEQKYRGNPIEDENVKAMKEGKRTSSKGNVYYENRKNRSDKKKWL
jgi:hypothetical protein